MRYAVLFCQAARIDQSLWQFPLVVGKGEAKINPRIRRRLDLSENVLALQRHDGRARTRLDVVAERFAKLQ
jgi:hypothetical protein